MNPSRLLAFLAELYGDDPANSTDDLIQYALTDLRHLADDQGGDWAYLDRTAAAVYDEERP